MKAAKAAKRAAQSAKVAVLRGKWARGSLTKALEKFVPGTKGKISSDSVKLNFENDDYFVQYDIADDYFRIKDKNRNQWVDVDGNVPKTGHLKGDDANDFNQQQTHINNTDQK